MRNKRRAFLFAALATAAFAGAAAADDGLPPGFQSLEPLQHCHGDHTALGECAETLDHLTVKRFLRMCAGAPGSEDYRRCSAVVLRGHLAMDICDPRNVAFETGRARVIAWLVAHPQTSRLPATEGAHIAWRSVFPCL